MKNILAILLAAGLAILMALPSLAQSYPLWLNDPNQKYNEYPTAIATAPDVTATVGFCDALFDVDDLYYNVFYTFPCSNCSQPENIFINFKNEITTATWNALIRSNGSFNNQVNVQSTPQVDVSSNGDVYVSFTYKVDALVEDAAGTNITITKGHSSYDFAVVKFNYKGEYQWHITEGGLSDEYITDLDYNEVTGRLAIGAYIEGANSFWLGGSILMNGWSTNSPLGPNFNYGDAFAASYQDNGNSTTLLWARNVKLASYSTDVVQDDAGNVYLSGLYFSEVSPFTIAYIAPSSQYTDGSLTNNYFIVKFEGVNGLVDWAEAYGGLYNELNIAPDKRLRYSSLAISPQTSELYFAMMSTGGAGPVFPEFGTYVNKINPSNGSIIYSMTVGDTKSSNTNSNVPYGSPTYNPSIAVDANGQVCIAGNFALTYGVNSVFGTGFRDLEIGNTYVHNNMGANGFGVLVAWYTAILDLRSSTVYNENLNYTYIPSMPFDAYNQLPVYGIAQDIDNSDNFYHVLGFNLGRLELDLTANVGTVNKYDNTSNKNPQFDGLILRTNTKNGQLTKRAQNTGAQSATTDVANSQNLKEASNSWSLSPNPVAAGQSLLWKSKAGDEVVDYIRLIDLTGRVLQEWKQPKATAQGFQLPIGDLPTGTYVLEASGKVVQQSTMVVVK